MKCEENFFQKILKTVAVVLSLTLVTFFPALTIRAEITTSTVGSLEGRFHASPNGDAVYEVKIPVPPGIQKIEPTLSLHYVSSAPNGIAGLALMLGGALTWLRCR